ncbi:hypothetical protein ANMWB30_02520 [Arthrobacter sp. MWB30]|nr:hypothetical protein ANMWB30_02520 [Arthrobacter sp. MWB30]
MLVEDDAVAGFGQFPCESDAVRDLGFLGAFNEDLEHRRGVR